jgi:hypothetical protein
MEEQILHWVHSMLRIQDKTGLAFRPFKRQHFTSETADYQAIQASM